MAEHREHKPLPPIASIYEKDLWKNIGHLKTFLPEFAEIKYFEAIPEIVIGWGKRKNSIPAKMFSKSTAAPYISLEEGFIHSVGKSQTYPALSIIADKATPYYDNKTTSGLENFLLSEEITDENIKKARNLIQLVKDKQITKYNIEKDYKESSFRFSDSKNILLLDQFRDDPSVPLAGATKADFDKMVYYARKLFPASHIVIKSYPEIILGKKKGFLTKYYSDPNIKIIEDDINIFSLLPYCEAVFTVTSAEGLQALIGGRQVYTFGRSFYSGWGFTKDNKRIIKNRKQASFEEFFYGSYVSYPRYINPYERKLSDLEYTIGLVEWLREKYKGFSRSYSCFGFSSWKKDYITNFLLTPFNEVKFFKNEETTARYARKHNSDFTIAAEKENPAISELCKNYEVSITRIDDGFIRSSGLPSNFAPASSLIIDDKSIHYIADKESKLEELIINLRLTRDKKNRARDLINLITQKDVSKYNFSTGELKLSFPRDKKIILVAGQIEDDPAVKLGRGTIKSNARLLEETRKREKDAYIIYKPHPEVVAGKRLGHLPKREAQRYSDMVIEHANIHDLIKRCDEVYTISSFVGFEALLRSKKVKTFGCPFYAGWGLTDDSIFFSKRNRNISLEHLVYAALIEYPIYFDRVSNLPCKPEDLVKRIISTPELFKDTEKNNHSTLLLKLFRKHFR